MALPAAASASALRPRSWTGIPAFARHIAIPRPMTPVPITAAVAISRTGVSGPRPGTRAISRSAAKTWRCARDCAPFSSVMHRSSSCFSPCAKGSS